VVIRSSDRHSSLTIQPGDFDDPQNYAVTVSAEGFSGAHSGIFFEGGQRFLSDLRQLAATRRGRVVLTGTEDFSLAIESFGRGGALWLELRLSRFVAFNAPFGMRQAKYSLQCAFDVEAEYVNDLVSDFGALLDPPRSARGSGSG